MRQAQPGRLKLKPVLRPVLSGGSGSGRPEAARAAAVPTLPEAANWALVTTMLLTVAAANGHRADAASPSNLCPPRFDGLGAVRHDPVPPVRHVGSELSELCGMSSGRRRTRAAARPAAGPNGSLDCLAPFPARAARPGAWAPPGPPSAQPEGRTWPPWRCRGIRLGVAAAIMIHVAAPSLTRAMRQPPMIQQDARAMRQAGYSRMRPQQDVVAQDTAAATALSLALETTLGTSGPGVVFYDTRNIGEPHRASTASTEDSATDAQALTAPCPQGVRRWSRSASGSAGYVTQPQPVT